MTPPTSSITGFPGPEARAVRGEAGSVSAEIAVFVAPILILLTVFVVFCGRSASAAIDVHAAAAAGARAAADTTTPAGALQAATGAVAAATADTRWACTSSVDTHDLRLGGQVAVTVDCRINLSDLGLPGTGSRTVRATATQPIDTYRAGP
jgi:Flp pilus assembly protein TadG